MLLAGGYVWPSLLTFNSGHQWEMSRAAVSRCRCARLLQRCRPDNQPGVMAWRGQKPLFTFASYVLPEYKLESSNTLQMSSQISETYRQMGSQAASVQSLVWIQ